MTGQSSRTGTELGPYRIGTLLGRGGMGEVYEAYDSKKDRTVALKLLPPQLANSDDFRERFLRESRTAARLSEPHIIPIHDFGEIDGLLYIDMRMVNGRDLRAELSAGPLPPARAVHILGQIASALDAAHRSGLVHRDVKPDNILVDENDFAYLVDFGIAHGATETRLTVAGSALGSLAYMAPERFGDEPAGPPADVYSLACVLYETLTGSQPFGTTSMQGLMTAHITAPPPTTGTAFDPVIARGMAKDPAQRYSSAREFARAAGTALTAPAPPRPTPPPFPPHPAGADRFGGPPATSGPTIIGPAAGPQYSGPQRHSGPQPSGTHHPVSGPNVAGPTVSGPAVSGPTISGPAAPPPYGSGSFGSLPPGGPSGPQGLYGSAWGPSGPTPPTKGSKGRLFAILGAVAVVVAILAVVGIVAVTGDSSEPDPDGPVISSQIPANSISCTYRTDETDGPSSPKPAAQQPKTGTVQATLNTSQGSIGMLLDREPAPCNVAAIQSLIQDGYYDNTTCHRLTGDATSASLICGDPTGTQGSSPGWRSPDEPPTDLTPAAGAVDDQGRQAVTYPRGTIGVTNIDPKDRDNKAEGDGASTFFMIIQPIALVPYFTVIGTVDDDGLAVLDKVAAGGYTPDRAGVKYGRPNQSIVISTATVEQ